MHMFRLCAIINIPYVISYTIGCGEKTVQHRVITKGNWPNINRKDEHIIVSVKLFFFIKCVSCFSSQIIYMNVFCVVSFSELIKTKEIDNRHNNRNQNRAYQIY